MEYFLYYEIWQFNKLRPTLQLSNRIMLKLLVTLKSFISIKNFIFTTPLLNWKQAPTLQNIFAKLKFFSVLV